MHCLMQVNGTPDWIRGKMAEWLTNHAGITITANAYN
jgi:hypothetical protein